MAKAMSRREKVFNKVCNMKRPLLLRLCQAAELSESTLQRIRSGQTDSITDETVDKLADALGY